MWTVIVAGGSGSRMGGKTPKQFLKLHGRALWRHSVETFAALDSVEALVLVVPAAYVEAVFLEAERDLVHCRIKSVVAGGRTRRESVLKGLREIPSGVDFVAIHDAARPFVDSALITQVYEKARVCGAAVPVHRLTDTLLEVGNDGMVFCGRDRNTLKGAETPQIFRFAAIIEAHGKASAENLDFTDDATLFMHYGYKVAAVEHDGINPKITTAEDWRMYANIENEAPLFRSGQGIDVHPLVEGRRLILGGVEIKYPRGLDGHSDADVLAHAVADALLGGANLGDIGHFYPSSDERYRGCNSLELLSDASGRVREAGFEICFMDATVVAQEPKIAPYRKEMAANLACAMDIDSALVSVKGTTTDHLGAMGRGEGIMALALATLKRKTTP